MGNQQTQQEIAALAQAEEYRQQVGMMRKIYKPIGFFEYYFEQLPKHKTSVECFNHVNDLHMELFGEPKYSSFVSFQNSLRYIRSKNEN